VLPVVSIVGRPNVGKSSLFNRILRKRVAVVDDMPGVTRDRNYRETAWNRSAFNLVDTGGLIPSSKESIPAEIHIQVDIAIEESAAIIFLVEASVLPTEVDLLIAKRLKKQCREKVILVANKADAKGASGELYHYLALGLGEPVSISALHGKGVGDLLDRIVEIIRDYRPKATPPQEEISLSLAIAGRPNAGKSSFVNKLLGSKRMIVDDQPGTTRDAVDSIMTYTNLKIRLIDTAGLRKKSHVDTNTEYYCNLRALESIKRCDICVLLVDTAAGIGEQDLKILTYVQEQKKGVVVCWNKWDLVEKDHKTFDALVAETKRSCKEMQYIPMVSTSALTGQRVLHVIDRALLIQQNMTRQIGQSDLTELFFDWKKTHPHPFTPTKQVRFLGIKQMHDSYPHFVVFCTNHNSVFPSYERFLINKLYETADFSGCPLVLSFKSPSQQGRQKAADSSQDQEKELS